MARVSRINLQSPNLMSDMLQGAQNLAQGMSAYLQMQQNDAAAVGRINAFMQNPQAVQTLSPNAQQLLQKQLQGKAKYNDRLQLLGEMTASQDIQNAQADLAFKRAQAQALAAQASQFGGSGQLDAAKAAQIRQQMGWLQNLMSGPGSGAQAPSPMAPGTSPMANSVQQFAQPTSGATTVDPNAVAALAGPSVVPEGGTGQPEMPMKPGVKLAPPTPFKMTDPQYQAQLPMLLQKNLGNTDAANADLQKMVDADNAKQELAYKLKSEATGNTGNYYFKRALMKDGLPQGVVLVPEIGKGVGTVAETYSDGTDEIEVPFGTPSPGNIVQRGDRQKSDLTPERLGTNTNDPNWIKDGQDAWDASQTAQQRLANAALLKSVAHAYADGGSGQMNAVLAQPAFAQIRQLFSGKNPVAALKTVLAANTQGVLDQIRGPTGSVGGRILQTEYENTNKMMADPTMDPNTILAAVDNYYNTVDKHANIDNAYALYRQTMPADKATKLAIAQFGGPPAMKNAITGQPVAMPEMKPIQVFDRKTWASLPKGTKYIDPNGKPGVKLFDGDGASKP